MTRGVDRGDAGQAEVPLEVGVDKGGHEGAGGAVDMHRDVETGPVLELVEGLADLLHRFVGAVEGRSKDGDHVDRVLVAARHRLLGGEVEAIPSIGTRRISMFQ
jgi:hypothetical protein